MQPGTARWMQSQASTFVSVYMFTAIHIVLSLQSLPGAAIGAFKASVTHNSQHSILVLSAMHLRLVQVCEHLQRVGKVCGVWVVPIVGGISPVKQERMLKKLPEVTAASLLA